jgi:ABC-type sugar transport system substrate-binding protein
VRKAFLALSLLAMASMGTPSAHAKDITLGAVQMDADLEWFRTVELGMRAAADKAGANLLVANAQGQVDTEAAMVDNFVSRGVNAIIISALNADASVPALKRAVDAGIKLVDYNSQINSPIMTSFVGVNNTELGALMGRFTVDYVKTNMNGKAKIALLTVPKYEPGRQRRDGFVAEIAKEPGIQIVAEQEGMLPEPAANTLETILQAHPDVDLVWTANEGGVVGAISAKHDTKSRVKIFGTDMSLQVAKALLEPRSDVIAIATQDPYTIGYRSTKIAIDKVEGKPTEKQVIVPLEMFTAAEPAAVQDYLVKYQKLAK